MKYVKIEVTRDEYSPAQVSTYNTCTIGQLREWCDDYDDETIVILSHDGGYTYGGLPIDTAEEGDTDNE